MMYVRKARSNSTILVIEVRVEERYCVELEDNTINLVHD